MTPISGVLVSSSDVVVDQGQKIRSKGAGVPGLKRNQIIEARVVNVSSPRRIQLMISGQKVIAKTHLPFKEGDQIRLRVASSEHPQIFKFIGPNHDPNPQSLAGFLNRLGHSGPYGKLLQLLSAQNSEQEVLNKEFEKPLGGASGVGRFREIADDMALKSEIADPVLLKKIIRGSGLLWEHKLMSALRPDVAGSKESLQQLAKDDLKAVALGLMASTDEGSEESLRHIRSFVETLGQLQLLNRFAFDESGKVLLPLPLVWGDLLKFGQLFIDLGDVRSRKEACDRMVRVSMLLEMTNLGDIRADFSILKKCISGTFGVGNETLREFFDDQIPELVDRLQKMKFTVQKIDCHVMRPETLASTSLADKMMNSEEGTLNLMI